VLQPVLVLGRLDQREAHCHSRGLTPATSPPIAEGAWVREGGHSIHQINRYGN
jgi:hypothetical protein